MIRMRGIPHIKCILLYKCVDYSRVHITCMTSERDYYLKK
jgi:hypothetical protein